MLCEAFVLGIMGGEAWRDASIPTEETQWVYSFQTTCVSHPVYETSTPCVFAKSEGKWHLEGGGSHHGFSLQP